MTERFQGRVAAVTGAAGALGRATAARLAAEGARLVLFDRDASGLATTAALCPDSVTVIGDVSRAQDVENAARAAQDAYGGVELLAAAAGIIGPAGPAIEVEEEEWDRLFSVNVKGAWLTARAFIPQMRARGGGSVVLFSSTAGLVGSRLLSAYSASKGAVTLLARSLALNHAAEGIRVNCVCPGTIDSPMTAGNIARAAHHEDGRRRMEESLLAMHPMNRFGTPEEVAEAVLYLLSDAASFTTGAALPVDGGRLA